MLQKAEIKILTNNNTSKEQDFGSERFVQFLLLDNALWRETYQTLLHILENQYPEQIIDCSVQGREEEKNKAIHFCSFRKDKNA